MRNDELRAEMQHMAPAARVVLDVNGVQVECRSVTSEELAHEAFTGETMRSYTERVILLKG